MEQMDSATALSELTKPEHAVLLISGSTHEHANIMVAGWVMRVSHTPPLMAVSVGLTRYTHKLMEESDEFVLSYPVKDQEQIIAYCGSRSGRDVDKIEALNIKTAPAKRAHLPILAESRANFECAIVNRIRAGDHTIFVGEVLAAWGNPSKNPLINVGNERYEEFTITR